MRPQTETRNGLAHVPAGRLARPMAGEVPKWPQAIKSWLLRSRGSEPVVGIEVFSGLPHDMEHHSELARQRHGGALEAETLLKTKWG
jgi:hypothetical protein